MAKNNEKNTKNNKDVDSVPSAVQVSPPKVSQSKPQEESHGGLIAAIVALVALIIIGGGVLAFVLLIKAKNKYVDPITKPKTGAEEGLGVGITSPSTGEVGAIIPEVPITPTTPVTPTVPVVPDTLNPPPVVPDDTPDPPPADEDAEDAADAADQPVPVVYYNFDAQLSRMDTDMEGVNPDKLDSGEISGANVGL
ncbi:MAG: hypothetical protein WCV59_04795 [Parcubacteria group bacterium]|jgi:hypothetical protein